MTDAADPHPGHDAARRFLADHGRRFPPGWTAADAFGGGVVLAWEAGDRQLQVAFRGPGPLDVVAISGPCGPAWFRDVGPDDAPAIARLAAWLGGEAPDPGPPGEAPTP